MNDRFAAAQALRSLARDRQRNRLLRLSFPRKDGPSAMLLVNQLVAHEGLSRDFQITLELLSDDPRIELKDLQGKMVAIELVREDGSQRWFNGLVFEFRLVRSDSGYVFYEMLLLPWLAYLRLRQDNYLFHGKTLYDQTAEICRDYNEADWKTRVTGPDEPMTDACQYAESDYNYLHRRWEAAGWHYWYEHRADGHTLVLGDDTRLADAIDGATPEIPWQNTEGSREDDGIAHWTPVRRLVPASVALSSFDFKNPRPAHVEVPTINQQGNVLRLEVYEYAGAYGFKNHQDGDKLVRRRIEEIEGSAKHFEARGNDRTVQAGRWFRLTGHYDVGKARSKQPSDEGDAEFLVLHVTHEARNNYLQDQLPAVYTNTLRCTRKKVPWRPGRSFNSEEPKIYGLQTAIVVGPAGEEIHTDEHGRIQVQFHWDRAGKNTAGSSAWIRVAQPWAGAGWGAIAIPRVGQEVVVQFLDGNVDRPLVTGSLFNARNPPPYPLPAAGHMMGFKSNSTPGGGGYSEMAIHDAKGSELLKLRAQKDMLTTVLDNQATVVHGAQQTVDVTGGFQQTTVKQHIVLTSAEAHIDATAATAVTLTAGTTLTLQCGASSIRMDQDGNIVISGSTVTVTGTDRIDINEA